MTGARGRHRPARDRQHVLCGSRFTRVSLKDAFFGDARLMGAELNDVNATGLRVENVNLSGARFHNVNLSGRRSARRTCRG
jgi:uncharacterized protein YjbI with pentapeptide repeats